jgi:ABC-2 type transport system ATP-binding protein
VAVLGFDPGVQPHALKDRIGVCLQATNLPEKIKVGEAVRLFGSFYSRSVCGDALLDRLQLSEKRDAYYSRLSGGQKQRLAVALALVNDPQVLFLDEPTAGLDPQARLEIRNLVEELRSERRTILLTTHYIEEAERLCDRVAIIDEGRIIAIGAPREIQSRTAGRSIIEIECDRPLNGAVPCFAGDDTLSLSENRCSLAVASREPARALVELVKWIDQQGAGLSDIHLKRPTLEDVFIELTGKRLGE